MPRNKSPCTEKWRYCKNHSIGSEKRRAFNTERTCWQVCIEKQDDIQLKKFQSGVIYKLNQLRKCQPKWLRILSNRDLVAVIASLKDFWKVYLSQYFFFQRPFFGDKINDFSLKFR